MLPAFQHAEELRQRFAELSMPILLLNGTEDKIVSVQYTRDLFAKLDPARARLIEYEGAYHNLLFDLDKDKVMADLTNWLDEQIAEQT